MTATYLAQLSEARSILARPSDDYLPQILKPNLLLLDSMYVGATDLLCNEMLHKAVADEESQFANALLKPRDGSAPALRPVMYEERSFTALAEVILADSTITPMKSTPQKRDQLLRHAERLDELGPLPKLANNKPFRPNYWETLRKKCSLLARERERQPVVSVQAKHVQHWLESLPPGDIADFRQSAVYEHIATLQCDESSKRVLQLVSDTEYQSMMAECSGAMVSKDVRFKDPFSRQPPADSEPTVFEVHADAASVISAPLLESFNYMHVLELSSKEPFQRLRQLMRDAYAGKIAADAHQSLLDDCTSAMEALSKKNSRQRRVTLSRWRKENKAESNNRWLMRTDMLQKAGGVLVYLYSGDMKWLLATSALSLAIAASHNRKLTEHKIPSANFISAGEAYHTVLSEVEEWQRV